MTQAQAHGLPANPISDAPIIDQTLSDTPIPKKPNLSCVYGLHHNRSLRHYTSAWIGILKDY